jgi:hypothetical protein
VARPRITRERRYSNRFPLPGTGEVEARLPRLTAPPHDDSGYVIKVREEKESGQGFQRNWIVWSINRFASENDAHAHALSSGLTEYRIELVRPRPLPLPQPREQWRIHVKSRGQWILFSTRTYPSEKAASATAMAMGLKEHKLVRVN